MSGQEKRTYILLLMLALGGVSVAAQPTTDYGFALTLTNSGFGVGGYLRDSLDGHWALLLDLSVGPGKDEREVAYFNRFGQKSVPGKAHYLLVVPVQVGLQRRIFRERIDDNFRPFVQASAGPTVAWEYPYFFDCDGNGVFEAFADCNGNGIQEDSEGDRRLGAFNAFPDGRLLFGFGGGLAAGAYFGHGQRGARGFRIGYSFNYYLAGTSLLEVDLNQPRHYFGTPHVVVFFGRLF